jgi:hypothetical protein
VKKQLYYKAVTIVTTTKNKEDIHQENGWKMMRVNGLNSIFITPILHKISIVDCSYRHAFSAGGY